MQLTLKHIKTCVEQLAAKIHAPFHLLPTYNSARDAHPNIEIGSNGELSYEISERSKELRKDYALNLDHLLYLIFRDVTNSMASDFVRAHHNPNINERRLQVQKQLELLGILSEAWQQREKEYQEQFLRIYSPNDLEGLRQAYFRELLGNGFLFQEALAKVNEKYPLSHCEQH